MRKSEAERKNEMWFGIEDRGVRDSVSDRVALNRKKNYPWGCRDML